MDEVPHLWCIRHDIVRGGGVGLRHNILNKDLAQMCEAAYNPAVTNNPKIHGVVESGEEPPTGGRGVWGRERRGYPYME